jgi:hypothetical protein
LRNATATFNFENMPLQICVSLVDAITPSLTAYTSHYTGITGHIEGVMVSTKDTRICSGIFPKLEVAVAFLKFVEIAMASIQLTLI